MRSPSQLLHGTRVLVARTLSCLSARPIARKQNRLLAVHQKMILLGTWLLLSCAAVAGMGIWSVQVIEREQVELTGREVPALTQLLRIDIDLYEAQLGLERAAETSDAAQRKAHLAFYFENIAQSDEKFSAFKALAQGAHHELEGAAIASYEADRTKWRNANEELAGALMNPLSPKPGGAVTEEIAGLGVMPTAAPTIDASRALFEPMRRRLNDIILNIHEPAIEASAAQLDRISRLTCWKLFAGALFAIAAGIVLTRSMARVLRVQQQAAEAVNAVQTEQARRQAFETRLTRGLEMAQDEPAALRLVEQAIAIAAADVSTEILLADSSRAHLHQAATTGQTHPGCGCHVPKPSDCPAVRRGHRLNFESGGLFDACPYLKDRPGGNRSAVCIPLSIMGQTVGVLHATAADGQLPPENQVQALEQVASKAGERIGLLRAFKKTQSQASSDSLTGLMNRRSLEEKVHEITRQRTPFAVAYGDLDHFKNLNDTHGHETGDKALRTFAQVLKASVRPGDLAARWGGEEFVLVLPRVSADEAVVVLDRVRQALANVLRDADTPPFTVSFGVTRAAEGTLFVDALACADELLLRAKKDGRNRTVSSPDVLPARRATAVEEPEQAAGQDDELPVVAAA